MSGPKIDFIQLEINKRRAIEKKRRDTVFFQKTLQEISALCIEIESYQIEIISQIEHNKEISGTIKSIENIISEYSLSIRDLSKQSIPAEEEKVLSRAEELKKEALTLKQEFYKKCEPDFLKVKNYIEQKKLQSELADFTKSMNTEKQIKKNTAVDFQFRKERIPEKENGSPEVKKNIQNLLREITDIINSGGITKKDREFAMELAKKISDASNKNNLDYDNAITQYQYAKPGLLKRKKEFNDLYHEYLAEYVVYIEQLNAFRKQKIEVTPKEINTFLKIEDLRKEINILKDQSSKINEQNYIREQLDEVMQLHGYNLCEDVIFDTNQKGCHFLCPKKGRKTAIHIHISNISNSKQIMMEVVGTGEKQVEQANGVTHDFSDLTADAKVDESKLIQEQYNFCNIHPAITEDLRKRGVILGTIEHRKPDSKYCRKIITLIEEETNEGLFEDGSRIANISRVKRQKKSDVKEKSLMVKN